MAVAGLLTGLFSGACGGLPQPGSDDGALSGSGGPALPEPGTGGSVMYPTPPASGGNGSPNCQEFCLSPEVEDGGVTVSPPDAMTPVEPKESSDAGPDAGPPPRTGCPPPAAGLFEDAVAGSGAISGCIPKTCPGIDLETDPSWAWPDGQVDLRPYMGCTRIAGDLAIAGYTGSSPAELRCLERVDGNVLIWNNEAMRSLSGLDSLRVVTGDLEIGYHEALAVGVEHLTQLDALSNLHVVGGDLAIDSIPATSLHGLEQLRVVGGRVWLSFVPLQDLAGLGGLQAVGGTFEMWRTEGMVSTLGVNRLTTLGGSLVLWGSTALHALSGFEALSCIGNGIDLRSDGGGGENRGLARVDAFPSLEDIFGDVVVSGSPDLTVFATFATFPAGVAVHGGVHFLRNPKLRAIPGLSQVTGASELRVEDNPMLLECPLQVAADAFQTGNPTLNPTLTNNLTCSAPGGCQGALCPGQL